MTLFTRLSTRELKDMRPVTNAYAMRNSLTYKRLNKISRLWPALNVIYGLESPDDMVDALNSLVSECLDRHATLKKVKLTRPPAPWMLSDEIRELQTTRDKLRAQARCSGTDETWTAFRAVQNRIKAVIGKAKRAFQNTTLSSK